MYFQLNNIQHQPSKDILCTQQEIKTKKGFALKSTQKAPNQALRKNSSPMPPCSPPQHANHSVTPVLLASPASSSSKTYKSMLNSSKRNCTSNKQKPQNSKTQINGSKIRFSKNSRSLSKVPTDSQKKSKKTNNYAINMKTYKRTSPTINCNKKQISSTGN